VQKTLTFERYRVRGVKLGGRTELADGVLTLDGHGLERELMANEPRIERVVVQTAVPGESTRIVCTKDVIEPRAKPGGAEPGQGVSRVLDGAAVVTCGPIVGFQEGVIDMSGRGADYTPFSKLNLIVIEATPAPGVAPHEHEEAVRRLGLEAAKTIAERAARGAPDSADAIRWEDNPVDARLPRIAYVDMLLSQGLLHDTYVAGRNARDALPATFDPRAIVDGAFVSGNCVSACDKTTTYHHQKNPIITELLGGHGSRWQLVGVVATNIPTRLGEKQRSAEKAIELTKSLRPDGVIVSKEGFGNPDADLMMIVRGLEAAGIKTVAITDEFAGPDGGSQSLADTTPEADALISVGNANERIELGPMAKVIGPLPDVARLAGGYAASLHEDGRLSLELQAIVGSTNQLGFGYLSCREV
jgi:sarcosine reductase